MQTFSKSQTTPATPILLRAEKVAKILNVSVSLVYKLIETGTMPTVRINRSVRVKQSDLDRYIDSCWTGWKD